jgi:acetoin:2,6-dichlorophenolindophenol oxidoreductase subunit beta
MMSVETKKINSIRAINQAIAQAMAADPTVLVLGEDVADREGGGVVGVTRGLSTQFGDDRVKSTPISEQAIIGAAIGAAIDGYKPVAEIMLMNFTTVAMDMIFNHAAKLRYMSGGQTTVPIVIRMMTGAGIASGGQHSDFLEAWFAHTPGLKVVAPSNPADAKGLMLSCIADPDLHRNIAGLRRSGGRAGGRHSNPARQSQDRARRQRCYADQLCRNGHTLLGRGG